MDRTHENGRRWTTKANAASKEAKDKQGHARAAALHRMALLAYPKGTAQGNYHEEQMCRHQGLAE